MKYNQKSDVLYFKFENNAKIRWKKLLKKDGSSSSLGMKDNLIIQRDNATYNRQKAINIFFFFCQDLQEY